MVDNAANKDDFIRKTRMMVHTLIKLFPDADKDKRMVATAYALAVFENMRLEEASDFVAENYDAIYRTKGFRHDLARLQGYRDADDPRRKADTAKFYEDMERDREDPPR